MQVEDWNKTVSQIDKVWAPTIDLTLLDYLVNNVLAEQFNKYNNKNFAKMMLESTTEIAEHYFPTDAHRADFCAYMLAAIRLTVTWGLVSSIARALNLKNWWLESSDTIGLAGWTANVVTVVDEFERSISIYEPFYTLDLELTEQLLTSLARQGNIQGILNAPLHSHHMGDYISWDLNIEDDKPYADIGTYSLGSYDNITDLRNLYKKLQRVNQNEYKGNLLDELIPGKWHKE